MKFSDFLACNFFAAGLAVGATITQNLASFERSPGAVRFTFDKHQGQSFGENSQKLDPLRKRDDSGVSLDLKNEQNFYSVRLEVGTPAQEVVVLLDTGSSDLWVPGSENPYCKSPEGSNQDTLPDQDQVEQTLTGDRTATKSGSSSTSATLDCSQYGTFSANESKTFHSNDTEFSVSYGDGSYAAGTWGTDTLSVGGVNLTNVSIGVANVTNSSVGILGIGLETLENTFTGVQNVKNGDTHKYSNFPMMLKSEGLIEKNIYSLYLDSKQSPQGSILFGAVDRSKYTGPLYTVPMLNLYKDDGLKEPLQLQVTLQGVGIEQNRTSNTTTMTPVPALLDSGTTLVYLPDKSASMLAEQIGAQWDEAIQYYVSDCSTLTSTKLFYNFGGFNIASDLSSYTIGQTRGKCVLGIQPSGGNSAILGDMFMQHAYVVFDLENFEVSLAQACYNGTQEKLEVISKTIPGAIKAPGYAHTYSTSQSISPSGNIFRTSYSSSIRSATIAETSGPDNAAMGLTPRPLFALFAHVVFSFLL